MSENSIDQIKKLIVGFTNERWASSEKAFLLASMGQAISHAGFDLKAALRGEKLAHFVAAQVSDDVRIISSPADDKVLGLVPVSAVLNADLAGYFEQAPRLTSTAREWINFHPRLWAAFSRPLAQNMARVVDLEPQIHFEDIPASDASGRLTVDAVLIIPAGTMPRPERNSKLQDNIRGWLKDKGIPSERVIGHKALPESADRSVLDFLINELSESELRRIVIPMDIVAKLLQKKNR